MTQDDALFHHYGRHCIGLDLGRQTDPSALALLRWYAPPVVCCANPEWLKPKRQKKPEYHVPTLKRWPLGTTYVAIVDDVIKFLRMLPSDPVPPVLVVDGTGVGAAVCEMVRGQIGAAKVRGGMVAATITPGHTVTNTGYGTWNVAKRQLASVLQVLLGNQRLFVDPRLPEAATLQRELGTFSVKINPQTGNESFEAWRERDHDDLVLAVALAARAAETLTVWHPAPRMPAGLRV
jgi:hypothetical protein